MTFKEYVRKLQSAHTIMVLGSVALGLLSYFLLKPASGMATGQSLYVMIGSSASVFFLMLFALLQKQKIEQARQYPSLKDKLISFQNSYIMILAMLLGPTLLNFMLYGLGGPTFNFVIGLVFAGLLISRYINENRIIDWLKISKKEKEQLDQAHFSVYQ